MARILSFTMMIFLIVPAIAPALGKLISDFAGWRALFPTFIIFGLTLLFWFGSRLPETLPAEDRLPFRVTVIADGLRQMLSHPTVRLSIAVQTLMLGVLFAILTMVQPIFAISFDRAESFPYWFGAIALASGISSLLNARLVGRHGMRKLATWALAGQIPASALMLIVVTTIPEHAFGFYVVWQFGVLFQAGMVVANLNALAMEPMGHIAGMAASVIGSVSTVFGALIASPIGLMFDGTPRPLIGAVLVMVTVAWLLMHVMRRVESALVT